MSGPRDFNSSIDGLNVHAVLLSINLCIFDNIYNLTSHISYYITFLTYFRNLYTIRIQGFYILEYYSFFSNEC